MNNIRNKVINNIPLILITLLAIGTRLLYLSKLPQGFYLDEAYAAYLSWSIMTEGIDSWGYPFPVYFTAWGTGMNALYSYLVIPFWKLLGVGISTYRLPQAIMGIFCVYVIYDLGKELFEQKIGYLLAFVLAINPWHIMNTRFGLESNLAPGMFLVALWFLVRGLKRNHKYLLLSAVFFGGTLYAYAMTWIIIPLFLLLCVIFFYKQIPHRKTTFYFVVILFLFALPLLLFLAINFGWLPEIVTPFFSIPKMVNHRAGELSFANIITNREDIFNTIVNQYSGQPFVTSELVGAYYLFTTPLFLVGIVVHIYRFCKKYNHGKNNIEFVFLFWLISALLVCSMNQVVSTIHFNMIHIPLIFYSAYGAWQISRWLKSKLFMRSCLAFWAVSFVIFGHDYIKAGVPDYFYDSSVEEVIEHAKKVASGRDITIFGRATIIYGVLLWNELPSPGDFAENAVYTDDPNMLTLNSYDQFRYIEYGEFSETMEPGIYIIPDNYYELFSDIGFEVTAVNERYSVAIK